MKQENNKTEKNRINKVSDTASSPETNHFLQEELNNYKLLMKYIAEKPSITMDKELLQIYVKTKNLIEKNELKEDDEVEFWNAYDNLTSKTGPVTISSLRTILIPDGDNFDKPQKKLNIKKDLFHLTAFMLFICALIFLSNFYWITGTELLKDSYKLVDELRKISEDREINTYFESADKEAASLRRERKSDILNDLIVHNRILDSWNFIGNFLSRNDEKDKKRVEELKDQNAEKSEIIKLLKRIYAGERKKAEIVLIGLEYHLLPLLYGMLGSLLFVLRNIFIQLKELTYAHHLRTLNGLRIILGGVSGMTIGWFVKPDLIGTTGVSSSFSLAFLAGYSVDLLFALMDRIVNAFTQQSDKKDIVVIKHKGKE